MSIYKSTNGGYCTRCGLWRDELRQPSDYAADGKGSKSKKWYCLKCLKSKFDIVLSPDVKGTSESGYEIITHSARKLN
jgi:hypothetical protein